MTRKNYLVRSAALLAVGGLSVVGLAACSSTSGDAGTTDGANKPSADKPVSIEYIHRLPDGEGMTAVADVVAQWNEEHPEIQVTSTKFDGKANELIKKLETDINANSGPCLAQVGYAEVPDLFVKGLLTDVADEANKYSDDFSAGAMGQMKVGDAIVGLPQDVGSLVYFYNEAEYAALGLEVPTTAEELTAASATAAAKGKFLTAFTSDEAHNGLSALAAAAGDTWFTTEGDKWKVDTTGTGSETVAAFYQNLIDNKQTLATERWGDGFTKGLTDGSLIGHIGAAWEAGFLLDPLDGTAYEGQWRVAQLPDFGAGQMTGPDGGSGVAVMKGCENPAAAMEFNAWFNTQVDALASQGLVVAANGAVKTPEKMLKQFGNQDVLAELGTATANLNPDFPYAPGFSSLVKMNETAANVTAGSAKVSDIFVTAGTTAVDSLKSLGLPVAE